MAHDFGEIKQTTDGWGKNREFRICKLCGMSDSYGRNKPCDGWPECGTCSFLIKNQCMRYPPQLHSWEHPNYGTQIEFHYPYLNKDNLACGEHPELKEIS